MLRTILLAASMMMTIGIYVPFFKRVLRRQSTRDYSKMSAWFIWAIQCNGFALATAEAAHYLQLYYLVQIVLTGFQLLVIYLYWNTLPPLMREGK